MHREVSSITMVSMATDILSRILRYIEDKQIRRWNYYMRTYCSTKLAQSWNKCKPICFFWWENGGMMLSWWVISMSLVSNKLYLEPGTLQTYIWLWLYHWSPPPKLGTISVYRMKIHWAVAKLSYFFTLLMIEMFP